MLIVPFFISVFHRNPTNWQGIDECLGAAKLASPPLVSQNATSTPAEQALQLQRHISTPREVAQQGY